jgi:ribosomal-protein-alanine N-acetyltransferase
VKAELAPRHNLTPQDLAVLHAACFTTPPPWDEHAFGELLQSPYCFVCAETCGFLLGRVVAGEAELLTLAIAPEARRRGLAQRLVSQFLDQSKARAADSAFLEVSEENAAALALYRKLGFVQKGRRKGYYLHPDGRTADALIMVRQI